MSVLPKIVPANANDVVSLPTLKQKKSERGAPGHRREPEATGQLPPVLDHHKVAGLLVDLRVEQVFAVRRDRQPAQPISRGG